MVVVGLHPNCDLQALQRQYVARRFESPGRLQGALGCQNQSRVEPILEPQVRIFIDKMSNLYTWKLLIFVVLVVSLYFLFSGLICLPSRKATAT